MDKIAKTPKHTSDTERQNKIVAEARQSRSQREKTYREQALKIYPWVCARCGREFSGKKLRELTVHHRDHNHDYNPPDGSNWELLCLYCHDNEHSRYEESAPYTEITQNREQSPSGSFKPFADLEKLLKNKKITQVMAKDRYSSFKELQRHETLDRDYAVTMHDAGSRVTIIAPHGGKIEPRTSDLARRIAGDDYNFYCFEGIKDKDNACLHITSHRFDEPGAVDLVAKSRIVVAVHACTGTAGLVHIGGLNMKLGCMIGDALQTRTIDISFDHPRYQGSNPNNICNRGATGIGVQLEVTRDLRDDVRKVESIAQAVRAALLKFR